MTHVFIARRLFDAARVLGKLWNMDLFTHLTQYEPNGHYLDLLGTQRWQGDIADLVFLATVSAVSYFTYRWIERPGRDWVRDRVEARQRTAAARSVVSA
jgi:peptidoglycan/LPS O-acetylase OafA/YrhL